MRLLGAISQPEEVELPVAMPAAGGSPYSYVDRRFVLREQTPQELCEYEVEKARARERAVLEFAALGPTQHTKANMLKIWSQMLVPVVLALLSRPSDGGPPATFEEVTALTMTQRTQILEAQEQLSGLEECLGNAMRLFNPLLEVLAETEQAEA